MNTLPIPDRFVRRIEEFLASVRAGGWAGGGQVLLNVSPQAIVTSVEIKGRDEIR